MIDLQNFNIFSYNFLTASVSAQLGTLDKRYEDGSHIDLEDNTTRICGGKGVLRLYDDHEYSLIIESKIWTVEKMQYEGLSRNKDQKDGWQSNSGVINAFVESVKSGIQPDVDAREALKSMRVVFSALQSAKIGQRIEVRHE